MRNRVRASWLSVMVMVTVIFAGCYPFQGNVSLLLTPVPVDPERQAEIQEALQEAQAEAAGTPMPEQEPAAGEMMGVMATVGVNALRVRQSADPESPIVAGLRQGDAATVVGRTEDGSWIQIEIPDVGSTGWVAAEFVTLEGDLMALPVTAEAVASEPAGGETAASEGAGEGEAAAEMPAMTLNVDPAALQIVDGELTVPSLTSSTAGWLVVHADDGGTFGPVIGYAAVAEGENTNIVVPIDTEAATETVHLMLHEDGGVVGTYEFPGADAPVIVDGAPVSMAYNVGAPVTSAPASEGEGEAAASEGEAAASEGEGEAAASEGEGEAMAEMPSISLAEGAELQIVDGELTVPSITSSTAGWLVVHADNEGKPGPVLGYAAVAEGENTDVVIPIDTEGATETVHLMLHEDSGVIGTYEFPGADAPVMADGAPVMMAYNVGAPVTTAPASEGEGEAATSEGEGEAAASEGEGEAATSEGEGEAAMSAGDAAAATGMSSSELAEVNTRSLRVRNAPTADAEVVGGALDGDLYPVAEKSADGKWVRLYFPGTDGEAWVDSQFVDISSVGLNVKYGNVVVSTDGPRLRVRNAPSLDGEIVGHVFHGDIRYAIGASTDGAWVLLFLPDVPGPNWVSADYVSYQ